LVPSSTFYKEGQKLVDRREAARILGVSAGTIDNLRLRGKLPSVKIESRRLYKLADLWLFVERQREVVE
jgi:hypothetical protein